MLTLPLSQSSPAILQEVVEGYKGLSKGANEEREYEQGIKGIIDSVLDSLDAILEVIN